MRDLIARLKAGLEDNSLDPDEKGLAKRLFKTIAFLSGNPFHNSLQSHEIDDLSARFGQKVFQSYLENNTSSAGRLFWTYGPERAMITLVGLEPHPEDQKNGAYARVQLSSMPPKQGA